MSLDAWLLIAINFTIWDSKLHCACLSLTDVAPVYYCCLSEIEKKIQMRVGECVHYPPGSKQLGVAL